MGEKKIIGVYDYTVVLTYTGLALAYTGILLSINDKYYQAILCLMLAGFCDMFDGAIAATKNRTSSEKCFGIQIDSLADLISFGVFPGIWVYNMSNKNLFSCFSAFLFILCALIRLAFFNVQEEERQRTSEGRRLTYLGLPVTSIVIILPLFYLLYEYGFIVKIGWFSFMLLLMSAGFVSGIQIKKPQCTGKILLILLGTMEMLGLFLLSHIAVL